MEVFAVYPGRFHPFHRGHASSFNQLADQFGVEHTLLAISGKQEQPKSPFSVGDRAKMAMSVGVPKENIISIKQPYKAEEYIKYLEDKGLDPQDFALVFAVSKKDMEGVPEMGIPPDPRFTFKPKKDGSPSYLQPYRGNENDLKNMLQHAYVVSTDVEEFPIAGETMRDASTIRAAYKSGDEQKRNQILHDMYGKNAKHIKPIFDRELLQDAPSLREFYERIKPLLKEASIPKRVEMLKRLLEKRRRKGKRGVKVGRSITTGWWGGLNLSGDGGDAGGMAEAASPAQQAAIAVNMKKAGKKPKKVDEAVVDYLDEATTK